MQYMTKAAHCLEEICEVIHYCAKVTTSPLIEITQILTYQVCLKPGTPAVKRCCVYTYLPQVLWL